MTVTEVVHDDRGDLVSWGAELIACDLCERSLHADRKENLHTHNVAGHEFHGLRICGKYLVRLALFEAVTLPILLDSFPIDVHLGRQGEIRRLGV